MITKFKEFGYELTYDQALHMLRYERRIKDCFYDNYPNEDLPFSRSRQFSKSSINKTLSFAKKHKDDELIKLIDDYLFAIDNIQVTIDAKKYNV